MYEYVSETRMCSVDMAVFNIFMGKIKDKMGNVDARFCSCNFSPIFLMANLKSKM